MPLDLVGANGIPPPYIAHRLKICVSPDVVEIEDGRKSLLTLPCLKAMGFLNQ